MLLPFWKQIQMWIYELRYSGNYVFIYVSQLLICRHGLRKSVSWGYPRLNGLWLGSTLKVKFFILYRFEHYSIMYIILYPWLNALPDPMFLPPVPKCYNIYKIFPRATAVGKSWINGTGIHLYFYNFIYENKAQRLGIYIWIRINRIK